MITIKIQCVCGQRYAFDVDPGCTWMAWPISCPVCGADGTNSANAILASNNMAVPPAPPSEPLPASTAGPPVTQDKKRPLLPTRPPLNDNAARDLIEAKLHIKRAVSVALIMATVSFVLGLLSLFGYKILGASPFTLLHAGIVIGLGY